MEPGVVTARAPVDREPLGRAMARALVDKEPLGRAMAPVARA